MKRRHFNAGAATLAGGSALWAGAIAPAFAQGEPFTAGKDYVVLATPAPVDAPAGKIEVVEFFWYGCPHCNQFEPYVEAWASKAPQDVVFRRVHVKFNSSFVPLQKLAITLEAMKKGDEFTRRVFRAIQVDRVRMASDNDVFDWVGKQQGLDLDAFKAVYNSFDTANKVTKGTRLQDDYGVEGVPTMGVAGKYWTDGPHAGTLQRSLEVVDYLVNLERKKR